jgi:hypothetical protein
VTARTEDHDKKGDQPAFSIVFHGLERSSTGGISRLVRIAQLHYRTRQSCIMLWMLVSSIPSPLHIVGGAGGPGAAHMNLRRGPNICASGARSKRKAPDERSGSPMPEDRTRGNRASGQGGRLLGMGSETKRRRMGWP